MKKFIKIGLITGCLFILAGVGIATAAFALGTNPRRLAWRLEQLSRWDRQAEQNVYEIAGAVELPGEAVTPKDWGSVPAEPVFTEAASGTMGGSDSFEASYPTVSVLEIRQGGGNVELHVVEGQTEMTICGENANFAHVNYEETDRFCKVKIRAYAGESYRIFIPSAWVLDKLDVEISSGLFNGDGIRAREAEYQAESQGEIVASQSVGDVLEIDCEGGSIAWSAAAETVPPLIEAECERGEVALSLPGRLSLEQVGYSIECEYGTIELAGAGSFSGFDEKNFNPQERLVFLELSAKDDGAIYITQ